MPFLTKIKADDSVILYSSYLGGSETLTVNGLAVDKTGNAYIYGHSSGTDFPTTAGSYKNQPITNYSTSFGFVAKINATLSGAARLYIRHCYTTATVDRDRGGRRRFGVIQHPRFPGFPSPQALISSPAWRWATRALKLQNSRPTAANLVYSAFLGPRIRLRTSLDGANAAYITGQVTSAEYPTSSPTYQSNYAGGFLSKLSADGTQLLFSTFLSAQAVISEPM